MDHLHGRLVTILAVAALLGACGGEQPTTADTGTADPSPIDAPPTTAPGTTAATAAPSPTAATTTPAPTPTPSPLPTAGTTNPGATPAPDASPSAGVAPTPTTTATPFPANIEDDTGQPSGDPGTLAAVRVGTHPGYDRVVFDVDGGGTPGWTVGYVDDPHAQGSGAPVDVAGGAVLRVALDNTAYPYDSGVDGIGSQRVAGREVVAEVVTTGVYEGITEAFVGVTEERPFRARALDDGRVLLEVWHAGVGGG